MPYKSSLAVRYTRARMDDDIRRHVLHLTDRDCPLQGGGWGVGWERGGGRGAPAMPEHEAAGLSAMRGSGARGNPNRAYRRYTAIPLIDYVVCEAVAQANALRWLPSRAEPGFS